MRNYRDQKWARADWTEAPLISDRIAIVLMALVVVCFGFVALQIYVTW